MTIIVVAAVLIGVGVGGKVLYDRYTKKGGTPARRGENRAVY